MPVYEIEGVIYEVERFFDTNSEITLLEALYDYFKMPNILQMEMSTNAELNVKQIKNI